MSLRSFYAEASRLPGASKAFNIQPGESAVVLFDPLIEPKQAKFGKTAVSVQEYDEDEHGNPLWTPRTLYLTTDELGRVVRHLPSDDSRVCLLVTCSQEARINRDGTIQTDEHGNERYNRLLTFGPYQLDAAAMPERVVPTIAQRLNAAALESSKVIRSRPMPKPLT